MHFSMFIYSPWVVRHRTDSYAVDRVNVATQVYRIADLPGLIAEIACLFLK